MLFILVIMKHIFHIEIQSTGTVEYVFFFEIPLAMPALVEGTLQQQKLKGTLMFLTARHSN